MLNSNMDFKALVNQEIHLERDICFNDEEEDINFEESQNSDAQPNQITIIESSTSMKINQSLVFKR